MFDPVGMIERHFNINLKQVGRSEWRSLNGCPFCGDGAKGDKSDRFRIFLNGSPRYWCRQCNETGFVDALERDTRTPEEKRLLKIEAEQRRLSHQVAEQARRLTALEQMARCTDHLRYHQSLTDETLDYWFSEGMAQETIDTYLLGYCSSCPTWRDSASYTIPVIGYDGELVNIRHRLLSLDANGGKYRPHRAGLGLSLFNALVLKQGLSRVIVTEGEKKVLVAQQSGFDAVGICGQHNFKREWMAWFDSIPQVFVALDPNATESAERLAQMFGERARVVDLPAKLDDMIVKYGAGQRDVEGFLRVARRV